MTGKVLKAARKELGMTQVQAMVGLGVSQSYLSLLENEKRKMTDRLARKAVRLFGLSPSVLPLKRNLKRLRPVSNQMLVKDLASLKYPGYSHVAESRLKNPVTVLLKALSAKNLEARSAEALPWLLFTFSDMQWPVLVDAAKVKDLQNRLGFLTSLAKDLSKRLCDKKKFSEFERRERELARSRLMKEDTLCRESMTNVERQWLRQNRSPEARLWNILSDLTAEHLKYVE